MNTRSRKQPLTAVQIAEMSEGGNTELADGLYCVGRHLYVQIRGRSATWVLRWYKGPRVLTLGLGSLQTVAKGAAEGMRDKYLQMVRDGADPRPIHKALKRSSKTTGTASPPSEPVSTAPSVREVARDYIMKRGGRLKSTDNLEGLLKRYVYPSIEAVPVDAVTGDHLLAILQPLWYEHPPTARSVKALLRKVLNWAKAHGHRTGDNPANDDSLVIRLGGSVNHEPKSYKAISYRDAPRLWQTLAAQSGVVADIIMFQMLIGTRPSEAREARWSEMDLAGRTWLIPAERMKKGKEHRVPLSRHAIALLEWGRAS